MVANDETMKLRFGFHIEGVFEPYSSSTLQVFVLCSPYSHYLGLSRAKRK
ncbi:MAG: hypothetical protein Ct9H90mP16_12400 [Candidatus Poseidoniales archaeon]|nr:MAG: hypothetical protein Ct9H90mP16_12400 [Candidatus Poseidoniales archaeon]